MAPTWAQDKIRRTGSVQHGSALPLLQLACRTAGSDGPAGSRTRGHHGPLRQAGPPSRAVAGVPARSWAACSVRNQPGHAVPPHPKESSSVPTAQPPAEQSRGQRAASCQGDISEDISGLTTCFCQLPQAPGEQLGAAPACLGSVLPEPKGGITAEATGSAAALAATENGALSYDTPTRASALGSGDPSRNSQHRREAAPRRSNGGPARPKHTAEGPEWCPAGSYPSLLPPRHGAIPRESPRRLVQEPLLLGRS